MAKLASSDGADTHEPRRELLKGKGKVQESLMRDEPPHIVTEVSGMAGAATKPQKPQRLKSAVVKHHGAALPEEVQL
jgi:hypothetical protein